MRKPSKFGKYLLLDRIAVGGMAEVFVAKAFGVEGFERLLAIKKILPTMGEDPEFISMFVDEARIAVQLSHANIVQILELGKHDENLYIAMEYIAGRDVRQVLERFRKRGRPMPIPQACLIIAKVCEALDYAHRKHDAQGRALGIVHRDVSPQNVLVSYEGDIKLIDFGIAKAESRLQKTQAGILKGKFSYMSPEQVRGLSIDHRSDVFAVGVVLWELLTGEKLFTGESDFAVLEKVRQGLVPPPRQLNPAISETLQTVVMKALKAEVPERYQWASELHDDLMRFCVVGDMMYGSRQLAEWMREEFQPECEREQERLRVWMSATIDGEEATPPTTLPPEPRPPARIEPPPERKGPIAAASVPTPVAAPRVPTPTLHDRPPPSAQAQAMPTSPDLPSLKAGLELPTQQLRIPADEDTLALPPTPPGGSTPVAPPAAAAQRPFDMGELFSSNDKTPAGVSLQELPTMKMDGDVLAAAERALLAREYSRDQAKAKAEDTAVGAPRPLGDAALRVTVPEGVFAAIVADSLAPQRPGELHLGADLGRPPSRPPPPVAGNGSHAHGIEVRGGAGRPLPPLGPPPVMVPSGGAKPAASPTAATLPEQKLAPASLSAKPIPLSLFDEPTRSMPLQLPAKPEELAAAARKQEVKAAATQARRFPRLLLGGFALGAVVLLATVWRVIGEGGGTGTLGVSVRPMVPAEVFLDGKPVGAAPWSGRGIPAGVHQLEVRAAGYKKAARSVTLEAGPQPVEIPFELLSDAPPPLVADDVMLGKPRKAAPPKAAGRNDDEVPAPPPPQHRVALEPRGPPPPATPAPLAQPAAPIDAPPRAKTVAARAEKVDEAESAAPDLEPSNAPPRLRITTDPAGASISVDGKPLGKSPVVVSGLDPSHYHAVAAELDGFVPGRRAAKLEASGTTLMKLKLQARDEGAVPASSKKPLGQAGPAATTSPSGPVGYLIAATSPVARVRVDGQETGRWTPVLPAEPIALAAGDHTVVFVTPAGERFEEQVTIEAGKTKSLLRKFR